MQSQRIKNVQTKIRKRMFKGFPTRNQYIPIKNEDGKILRFKQIVHLLKPFKNESIQTTEPEHTENETGNSLNDEQPQTLQTT